MPDTPQQRDNANMGQIAEVLTCAVWLAGSVIIGICATDTLKDGSEYGAAALGAISGSFAWAGARRMYELAKNSPSEEWDDPIDTTLSSPQPLS